jgi:hypothetical protein
MAKKKPTQCDRVLEYLENHKGITPMDAWNYLGVYRLGARIWDLKNKRGINITKYMVDVPNRYGETCKVAEYRLEV